MVDGVLMTSERAKTLDLTHPWANDFITALIPVPEVEANTNAILKPFQWQVSSSFPRLGLIEF